MKKLLVVLLSGSMLLALTACGTSVSDQISNCRTRTVYNAYHSNPDLYNLSPDEKDAFQQKTMDECQAAQKDNPYGFSYKYKTR